MNAKNQIVIESIKYFFVGGACTVLDFILLYLGAEYFGFNYLCVSAFSFLCGVIFNYILCTYWIFDVRIVKRTLIEFILYVTISLVGLIINTLVIYLATNYFEQQLMISKLISACITYFWNFFARKYILHYKWNK